MAGRALLLSTPALSPLTQQLCSLGLFRDRDAAFLKGGKKKRKKKIFQTHVTWQL